MAGSREEGDEGKKGSTFRPEGGGEDLVFALSEVDAMEGSKQDECDLTQMFTGALWRLWREQTLCGGAGERAREREMRGQETRAEVTACPGKR